MENKLLTTESRRNYLVPEPKYHATRNFSDNFVAIEMKRTHILMNKPEYLRLSIYEINKVVMYGFWYD